MKKPAKPTPREIATRIVTRYLGVGNNWDVHWHWEGERRLRDRIARAIAKERKARQDPAVKP